MLQIDGICPLKSQIDMTVFEDMIRKFVDEAYFAFEFSKTHAQSSEGDPYHEHRQSMAIILKELRNFAYSNDVKEQNEMAATVLTDLDFLGGDFDSIEKILEADAKFPTRRKMEIKWEIHEIMELRDDIAKDMRKIQQKKKSKVSTLASPKWYSKLLPSGERRQTKRPKAEWRQF